LHWIIYAISGIIFDAITCGKKLTNFIPTITCPTLANDTSVISFRFGVYWYYNVRIKSRNIWKLVCWSWASDCRFEVRSASWRQRLRQIDDAGLSVNSINPMTYLASFFDAISGIKMLTNFVPAICTCPNSTNKPSSIYAKTFRNDFGG